MERGPLGLFSSLLLFGSVLLVMFLAAREGSPVGGPQLPQPTPNRAQNQPEPQRNPYSDQVEVALAKLKMVWSALDGKVDEGEIRKIAREWKNSVESQVLPQIQYLGRRLQDGQSEELAGEALDVLASESAQVRMRLLEEFGRKMVESGPVREKAAQLLGRWAQRLLGDGASELWNRLGY